MHVHTIPVDPAQTPEEAWREICIFGRRITYSTDPPSERWANFVCDGEECSGIQYAPTYRDGSAH